MLHLTVLLASVFNTTVRADSLTGRGQHVDVDEDFGNIQIAPEDTPAGILELPFGELGGRGQILREPVLPFVRPEVSHDILKNAVNGKSSGIAEKTVPFIGPLNKKASFLDKKTSARNHLSTGFGHHSEKFNIKPSLHSHYGRHHYHHQPQQYYHVPVYTPYLLQSHSHHVQHNHHFH